MFIKESWIKLVGCLISYNDMPLIKACVESLTSKVDKIICVDGKYTDFPGDCFYSTDGTLDYLKTIPKVEIVLASEMTEVEKRNAYLTKCNDGDIVLNLDTDEVLVGEIPPLTSDFGIIDLLDGHCNKIQKRATRFFKYREGMKYFNTHCTLYYQDKIVNKLHEVVNNDFSFEYIKGCHLLHNWHLRTHLRQHEKSIYYKKLVRMEQGFPK
jgi:hypothetical protein